MRLQSFSCRETVSQVSLHDFVHASDRSLTLIVGLILRRLGTLASLKQIRSFAPIRLLSWCVVPVHEHH